MRTNFCFNSEHRTRPQLWLNAETSPRYHSWRTICVYHMVHAMLYTHKACSLNRAKIRTTPCPTNVCIGTISFTRYRSSTWSLVRPGYALVRIDIRVNVASSTPAHRRNRGCAIRTPHRYVLTSSYILRTQMDINVPFSRSNKGKFERGRACSNS